MAYIYEFMEEKPVKSVDDFVAKINDGIKEKDKTISSLSLSLGIPGDSLYKFLKRKNLSINTGSLVRILDFLGYEIIIKKKKK